MSKISKIVGAIAGVVAVVASGGAALGLFGAVQLGGGFTLAGAASAISAGAGIVAQTTAKPPANIGSQSEIIISSDGPFPYSMGRTYVPGNLIHDVAHGTPVDDIPNPHRTIVTIYSGAGPIHSIEGFYSDFTLKSFSAKNAVDSYYHDYMHHDSQLGASPETSALSLPSYLGAIPRWGSSYKLSGYAAGIVSMRWDEEGKKYSSGVPDFGVILKGVMSYDARQDSTYGGGSGSHRIDDETTWTYSANPASHAVTYAFGRYQNGTLVCGGGMKIKGIDLPAFVALANVCDANGWTVSGTVYESGAAGETWNNLKLILQAAGAKPTNRSGILSVVYSAPKIALDEITDDDLVSEYSIPGMRPIRSSINQITPKYRSEAHKWEYVPSSIVEVAQFLSEDGEARPRSVQYDLVDKKNQAAQLALYEIYNARETSALVLRVRPRFVSYRVGDALTLNLPDLNLSGIAEITQREVNLSTGIVTLTLTTETSSKHALALGQIGTAPPTLPVIDVVGLDDSSYGTGGRNVVADIQTDIYNPITGLIPLWDDFSILDNEVRHADTGLVAAHSGIDVVAGGLVVTGGALSDLETAVEDGTTGLVAAHTDIGLVSGALNVTNSALVNIEDTVDATEVSVLAIIAGTTPIADLTLVDVGSLKGQLEVHSEGIDTALGVASSAGGDLIVTIGGNAFGASTNGVEATTSAVTANISGGTGTGYGGTWTPVSGDTFIINAPNSVTTTFKGTPTNNNNMNAVYKFTAHDDGSGVAEMQVSVTIFNSDEPGGGGLDP